MGLQGPDFGSMDEAALLHNAEPVFKKTAADRTARR